MSKVRVYEVAKQMNLEPKAVVALFQSLGMVEVKNHMAAVELEAVERVKKKHLEQQSLIDTEKRDDPIKRTVVRRRVQKSVVASPIGTVSTEVAAARRVAVGVPSERKLPGSVEYDSDGSVPAAPLSRSAVDVDSVPAAMGSVRALPPAGAPGVVNTRESTLDIDSTLVPRSSRKILPQNSAPKSVVLLDDEGVAQGSAHVPIEIEKEIPLEKPSSLSLKISLPKPSLEMPKHPLHLDQDIEELIPAVEKSLEIAPNIESAGNVSARSELSDSELPIAPLSPPQAAAPVPVRQKTGIEYWSGRPGMQMPIPANVPRTGIGGGATGSMPRRVQYDPRSGGAGISGNARVSSVRPGAPPPPGRPIGQGTRGGPSRGGSRGIAPLPSTQKRTVSTQEMSAHKKVIRIDENITLSSMAAKMSMRATELMMKIIGMGMTNVHINTSLDADTAKILASEFGWEVEDVAVSEEAVLAAARGVVEEGGAVAAGELETRAPVVTVMGHVDHGKTSLLDKIRKANVAAGEAGGITQHIGAYKVQTTNGTVVFLDTPGHEAFTQMRARGASVTDIVILVVAADDGVMPQTKEAVSHARAAKVPIIVAVNKVDKPGADQERVKRELVELGLQPEEWGGDTIFANVSAKTGQGVAELLEMMALQSEILDLRANPKKPANGTVLEALLDRGRGPVARVLIQDGTLRVGDFILAGPGFGKVRAMTNEHGKAVHLAGPSTPVEILGLSDVPGAGDPVHAVKDSKKAQEIAEQRKGKMAKSLIPANAKVSLEELSKRMNAAEQEELRVIIKGDVQGSVEAVGDAIAKLSGDKVKLSIVHAGVGAITEGDINLAIAARAIVVGFNVRPAGKAGTLAEENKIEIRLYSIIYQVVDDIKSAMEGLLPATLVEKLVGKAELRRLFKIKNIVIAGSYVKQGKVVRSGHVRVVRDDVVVHDGKIDALKRLKEDVKEVAEGFECGISVANFNDLKEGDVLECYEVEEIKQKL